MARKQERKFTSFNLENSPVVEENERLLNVTTSQQAQTTEAIEPIEASETIVQAHAQHQVQQNPQQSQTRQQAQVRQEGTQVAQTSPLIGKTSVGNRSKRTEQGITLSVPIEYYEQIALMKMRTGIPIRDIALQAVIEFVENHKND